MQVTGLVPYRRHDTWGYCLPDRTLVVEPRFEQAFPFGDHELAHVRQGQRSGLMRRDGTLAVEPVYDWIGNEDEGGPPPAGEGGVVVGHALGAPGDGDGGLAGIGSGGDDGVVGVEAEPPRAGPDRAPLPVDQVVEALVDALEQALG